MYYWSTDLVGMAASSRPASLHCREVSEEADVTQVGKCFHARTFRKSFKARQVSFSVYCTIPFHEEVDFVRESRQTVLNRQGGDVLDLFADASSCRNWQAFL